MADGRPRSRQRLVDWTGFACTLSFAMMLRYSFDMGHEADLVETAVKRALDAGVRTADLVQGGTTTVSCSDMGDAILKQLEKAA